MAYPSFRFKPNDIYTDTLDGDISAATDPINTLDNTNAEDGPGLLKFENEIVKYTTKGANQYSGLTRGYNDTTASSHPSGIAVTHPISADIFVKIWEAIEALYGGAMDIVTTKGDILVASAADTLVRLGIGTDGHLLAVSTDTPGWVNPNTLDVDKVDGIEGTSLKANEIIIMANGFVIDGSSCELVEADGTADKVYCKHLAVAKTEWFDVPKFRVPDDYDGGNIVINVCFRSAGVSKTHSLGIRVASVATGEAHNPDTAAAYQLYNAEASDADIGEVKIKTVTVTQAHHLMVAGEIWHCKFVMEDDAECDADDVLIDWVAIEWNKG